MAALSFSVSTRFKGKWHCADEKRTAPLEWTCSSVDEQVPFCTKKPSMVQGTRGDLLVLVKLKPLPVHMKCGHAPREASPGISWISPPTPRVPIPTPTPIFGSIAKGVAVAGCTTTTRFARPVRSDFFQPHCCCSLRTPTRGRHTSCPTLVQP